MGFTTEEDGAITTNSLASIFSLHDSLLLLNQLNNIVFGRIMVPILKFAITPMLIICVSGLISFYKKMDLIAIVFVIAVSTLGPSILFLSAQIMSSIYDNSILLKRQMRDGIIRLLPNSVEIEYNRSMLKAMQPLRVQVGSLYHMERRVKLTLVDTIVHGIVSCLLLMKWTSFRNFRTSD